MPRPGAKKTRRHVGVPGDPLAFTPLLGQYLEHLRTVNLSKWTVVNHEINLHFFLAWCEERGLARVSEVTRPMVLQYQRAVFHTRKADGAPLGFPTQLKRVTSVTAFFRWLTREGHVPYNPAGTHR